MSKNKNKDYSVGKEVLTVGLVGAVAAGAVAAYKITHHEPKDTRARAYMVRPGDTVDGIYYKAGLGSDPSEFRWQLDRTMPHDAQHKAGYMEPGDKVFLPANSEIGKAVILKGHIELPSYPPSNKS